MSTNGEIGTVRHEEVLAARRRRLVIWAVLAVVALFGAWAFALSDYKLSRLLSAISSRESIIFITQGTLSILLGVISAVAYGAFENQFHKAAVTRIYSAGPSDLVDEALGLVERHRGTLMQDYDVEYRLVPSGTDGLLSLRVRYSYKKLLTHRDLFFRIMRLRNEEEVLAYEKNQTAVNALYDQSELFFYYPELDLRRKFGDTAVDASFGFEYIKVGGAKVELTPIPTDVNTVHYSVPSSVDMSGPVSLEYCFKYPVLNSDLVFCVIEYPTKGVEVRFTRDSALRDSIGVFACEFMSATEGNASVTEDSPGTHAISHSGWVLPKSGAVFNWYPCETGRK